VCATHPRVGLAAGAGGIAHRRLRAPAISCGTVGSARRATVAGKSSLDEFALRSSSFSMSPGESRRAGAPDHRVAGEAPPRLACADALGRR
jgi:hypothetical protein